MKWLLTLVSTLLVVTNFSLISGTAAKSIDSAALPYPVVEGVFTGEVDGVEYNITRNGNSVLSELMRQHPDFDFDARAAMGKNSTANGLQKRNKRWPPDCFPRGHRWETTKKPWADTLVVWGRAMGGRIWVPPLTCTLVNCRFDARWYLCNDNHFTIAPDVAYLASYVEDICNYKECQYKSILHGMNCGGQFFDTDKYNVIFRRRTADEGLCKWDT